MAIKLPILPLRMDSIASFGKCLLFIYVYPFIPPNTNQKPKPFEGIGLACEIGFEDTLETFQIKAVNGISFLCQGFIPLLLKVWNANYAIIWNPWAHERGVHHDKLIGHEVPLKNKYRFVWLYDLFKKAYAYDITSLISWTVGPSSFSVYISYLSHPVITNAGKIPFRSFRLGGCPTCPKIFRKEDQCMKGSTFQDPSASPSHFL